MARRAFNAAALLCAWALLVLLLIGLGALKHARAAPPAGMVAADPAVGAFYRDMKSISGGNCCDLSDCRPTRVDIDAEGRVWAWIGKEQFGAGAPDAWEPVPAEELRSRENRPHAVRGALICYFSGRVMCADLEAGI